MNDRDCNAGDWKLLISSTAVSAALGIMVISIKEWQQYEVRQVVCFSFFLLACACDKSLTIAQVKKSLQGRSSEMPLLGKKKVKMQRKGNIFWMFIVWRVGQDQKKNAEIKK